MYNSHFIFRHALPHKTPLLHHAHSRKFNNNRHPSSSSNSRLKATASQAHAHFQITQCEGHRGNIHQSHRAGVLEPLYPRLLTPRTHTARRQLPQRCQSHHRAVPHRLSLRPRPPAARPRPIGKFTRKVCVRVCVV